MKFTAQIRLNRNETIENYSNIEQYIKRDLVRSFADKMNEDNYLEITNEKINIGYGEVDQYTIEANVLNNEDMFQLRKSFLALKVLKTTMNPMVNEELVKIYDILFK